MGLPIVDKIAQKYRTTIVIGLITLTEPYKILDLEPPDINLYNFEQKCLYSSLVI